MHVHRRGAGARARYGVTVNTIYPSGTTRHTEHLLKSGRLKPAFNAVEGFDPLDPANVAPLIVWLGSEQSSDVSGRVFGGRGGRITVAEGWHAGPHIEKAGRWEVGELGALVPDLVQRAAPNANLDGVIPARAATSAPRKSEHKEAACSTRT